jgi:hypothetical protein
MIGDSLVDLVNWIIQTLIFPIFPDNFPLLSSNTYFNTLQGLKGNFIFAFSGIDKFFPIQLLLTFLLVIIVAELILFAIKMMMWFLNLVRGAGA